jgi:hypothetical protein
VKEGRGERVWHLIGVLAALDLDSILGVDHIYGAEI